MHRIHEIWFKDEYFHSMVSMATSGTMPIIVAIGQVYFLLHQRKKKVPFSLAIGNEEPMHECFPKHSRMGTAIMK